MTSKEEWVAQKVEKRFGLYLGAPAREGLRQDLSATWDAGVESENTRLRKVAQDYKEKGFELETFIYSGFLGGDDY